VDPCRDLHSKGDLAVAEPQVTVPSAPDSAGWGGCSRAERPWLREDPGAQVAQARRATWPAALLDGGGDGRRPGVVPVAGTRTFTGDDTEPHHFHPLSRQVRLGVIVEQQRRESG